MAEADRIAALRAEADQLEARTCTGVAAQWCPVHGTCRCPGRDDDMGRTLNDQGCPLHASASSHASGALAPTTRAVVDFNIDPEGEWHGRDF